MLSVTQEAGARAEDQVARLGACADELRASLKASKEDAARKAKLLAALKGRRREAGRGRERRREREERRLLR